MTTFKLWLSVKEFAPLYGRKPSAIYEQIRTGGFPFAYRRTRGESGSILISAHDAGLITAQAELARTAVAETDAKREAAASSEAAK